MLTSDFPLIRRLAGDISLVILILAIIGYFTFKNYKFSRERENAEVLAKELNEMIQGKSESDRKVISDIFQRQFETVDRFAELRYEYDDNKRLSAVYKKEIERMLRDMEPDSEEIERLKNYVNEHRDNIIKRFETEFPGLQSYYYTMFLYASLGLSARSMSVLFNISVETIYNRKSRLKSKISADPNRDSNEFLTVLNAA
ncbi:MAG: hypothetical protein NC343_06875 [Muribaculum sp.]|nr:hypothetical protein [Muribaculaceae bacterium]MCM1081459.1 hypothetical protein [Muribaculum sp.]